MTSCVKTSFFGNHSVERPSARRQLSSDQDGGVLLFAFGVTTDYPATIVLNLTAHLFSKNDECVGINFRQLRGVL